MYYLVFTVNIFVVVGRLWARWWREWVWSRHPEWSN